MKLLAATLAAILSLAACSSGSSPAPTATLYPVEGRVHAGPTCPTMSDPPAPGCEDQPVGGAHLVILDPSGGRVTEVVTDTSGRFAVELPGGEYTLVPQPVEGLLGTAPEQEFAVPGADELDVAYDTGIR